MTAFLPFPSISDAESPVITNCPPDISTKALSSNIPVQLLWFQPTASDNTAETDLLVSSHSPGDTFPSGQTQVTYTATDDAGNQATCIFIVDVQEVDAAGKIFFQFGQRFEKWFIISLPILEYNNILI